MLGLHSISSISILNVNRTSMTEYKVDGRSAFELTIPYNDTSGIVVDGLISDGEYAEMVTISAGVDKEIIVHWQYDNDTIAVALDSMSKGWLSMGFGSSMTNANMIFGGVNATGSYCYDTDGGPGLSIDLDTNKGGTDDIIACMANENDTSTILEFQFPMSTSDSLDENITIGTQIGTFYAYHDTSDAIEYHSGHSKSNIITFFIPPTEKIESQLDFEVDATNVTQGDTITLSLTLIANNSPLANVMVQFFMNTMFKDVSGALILNETYTNGNGTASFNYTNPTLSGERTFGAYFPSVFTTVDSAPILYLESTSTILINFESTEVHELTALDYFVYIFFGTIFTIVFFVYVVYAYNYLSPIRIFRNRHKEENLSKAEIQKLSEEEWK